MAFICNLCGKEGYHIDIRDHIETNHLEGVSLPCNLCGNVFSSRRQLRRHKCQISLYYFFCYCHAFPSDFFGCSSEILQITISIQYNMCANCNCPPEEDRQVR